VARQTAFEFSTADRDTRSANQSPGVNPLPRSNLRTLSNDLLGAVATVLTPIARLLRWIARNFLLLLFVVLMICWIARPNVWIYGRHFCFSMKLFRIGVGPVDAPIPFNGIPTWLHRGEEIRTEDPEWKWLGFRKLNGEILAADLATEIENKGTPFYPTTFVVKYRLWVVPYWVLILLLSPPVLIRLGRSIQSRKRTETGCCPSCGYDLRATPERCPECGLVPTAES